MVDCPGSAGKAQEQKRVAAFSCAACLVGKGCDNGQDDVKAVLDWCQKNNNMLHRWTNSLQALQTIKQFQKLIEQRPAAKEPVEPKSPSKIDLASLKSLMPAPSTTSPLTFKSDPQQN